MVFDVKQFENNLKSGITRNLNDYFRNNIKSNKEESENGD